MVGFFQVDDKGQFVEQVEAPSQAYVDRESEVCIEDLAVGCQRRWKEGLKTTVGKGLCVLDIEKPVAEGYRLYSERLNVVVIRVL